MRSYLTVYRQVNYKDASSDDCIEAALFNVQLKIREYDDPRTAIDVIFHAPYSAVLWLYEAANNRKPRRLAANYDNGSITMTTYGKKLFIHGDGFNTEVAPENISVEVGI